MGLDMYAYAVMDEGIDLPSIMTNDEFVTHMCKRIFNWENHAKLQGFMAEVYAQDYGGQLAFNTLAMKLTKDQLDRLERTIHSNALPSFMPQKFSQELYDATIKDRDLLFVERARDVLSQNLSVYYTSWW